MSRNADNKTKGVGYRCPPRHSQFKPGQSGNPKGRPKGSRSTHDILRDILNRKLAYVSSGRSRIISVREGILTKFADCALRGDVKTATFLLNRYDAGEGGSAATDDLNEDDNLVLQAFAHYVVAAQKKAEPTLTAANKKTKPKKGET